MFEAVRAAILHATEEAVSQGWTGADLQAHIFVAAFNAATSEPEKQEADDE